MVAHSHEITIHPRIIWTGVVVALIGMLDTGLMMVLPVSVVWTIVGVVVIAAGLGLAWFGGVMGDVHGGAGHGSTTTGVLPGARSDDAAARRDARATARRTGEQLDEATDLTQAPDSMLTTASLGLVAVSAWLLFSPWLFGFSLDDGAGVIILDQAIAAIVVGLCGLYAHQAGPNLPTAGLAAIVALAVLADGLFRHTLAPIYDVNQVVVGLLMLGGAGSLVKVARSS